MKALANLALLSLTVSASLALASQVTPDTLGPIAKRIEAQAGKVGGCTDVSLTFSEEALEGEDFPALSVTLQGHQPDGTSFRFREIYPQASQIRSSASARGELGQRVRIDIVKTAVNAYVHQFSDWSSAIGLVKENGEYTNLTFGIGTDVKMYWNRGLLCTPKKK